MSSYRVAIIGIGKIAQDQHLPVIARSDRFELAAVVSQRGVEQPGVPTFRTPAELFAGMKDVDAVAICTPPPVRHAIARQALDAGKHVLLEKPPTQTMAEFHDLAAYAEHRQRVIFATWHSQYNAGVEEARRRLAGQSLRRVDIQWKEDVRRWHPGQDWVWEPGGFGVFDPGINALSILTRIAPQPLFVTRADLVYPANRDTPIAASLTFSSPAAHSASARLSADFDWRQTGDQTWTIAIETGDGVSLVLSDGGSKLSVGGKEVVAEPMAEYEKIYERFGELLDSGESVMDAGPFQLVSDAFLIGRRVSTDAFEW